MRSRGHCGEPACLPHLSSLSSWLLVLEQMCRLVSVSMQCIHLKSAGTSGSHINSLQEGQSQFPGPGPPTQQPSVHQGSLTHEQMNTDIALKGSSKLSHRVRHEE